MGNGIDELSVNSKFKYVIDSLKKQLDSLDSLCVDQVSKIGSAGFSLDVSKIETLLSGIDKMVINNPVIKSAMIEGNEDVKKIISAVNNEISSRMESFRENFEQDTEKENIEKLSKDFSENKLNSTNKNLEEFESQTFAQKNMEEREQDEKLYIEDLNKRIDNAKKYQEVVAKNPGINPANLKVDISIANMDFATIDDYKKTYIDQLKPAEEYEQMVSSIYTKAVRLGRSSTAWSLQDRTALSKDIKALDTIKGKTGNANLDKMIDEIKSTMTFSPRGSILSVDSKNLVNVLDKDDYTSINWETSIDKVKEDANIKVKEDLTKILEKNDLFKVFPQKAEELLENLKNENPNIEFVTNQLDAFLTDRNLFKQIKDLDADSKNLTNLELELLKAKSRATNLKNVQETIDNMNKRQKTTTAKVLGKDLEIKDDSGRIVDFANLDDSNRSDAVDVLYEQMVTESSEEELAHIDEEYRNSSLPVKYKQPGLFSRILYKLNPRNWNNGKSLADERKELWVREKIDTQLKDIKEDASKANPVWTLSPEQQRNFENGQREILNKEKEVLDKAKQKGREEIVKNGKNVKDASKDAKQALDENQKKEDEDLTL